jgi:hypothetical protein
MHVSILKIPSYGVPEKLDFVNENHSVFRQYIYDNLTKACDIHLLRFNKAWSKQT